MVPASSDGDHIVHWCGPILARLALPARSSGDNSGEHGMRIRALAPELEFRANTRSVSACLKRAETAWRLLRSGASGGLRRGW